MTDSLTSSEDLLRQWLESLGGEPHSHGCFTVDSHGAERHAGIAALDLADVPLLLLAGAVEGGSGHFRVHDQHGDLRFSWRGSLGASGSLALSILQAFDVDARFGEESLALPRGFRDYLQPLSQRSRHAPLDLIWGDRLCSRGVAGRRVMVTPSRRARLLLVDRGVDFSLPAAFPDLDLVAWVSPLRGAPWPRRLVLDETLGKALRGVARIVANLPSHARHI